MKGNPKSYDQLRCIWALAHELNLSSDQLREKVQELFPETKGHLSLLTADQAKKIIEILKQKTGQSELKPALQKYGRQSRTEPRKFMSPAQTEFALALARQIIKQKMKMGEFSGEDAIKTKEDFEWESWHLLHKLARRNGLDGFDFANTRQAAQIIEALKAMKERLLSSGHSETKPKNLEEEKSAPSPLTK